MKLGHSLVCFVLILVCAGVLLNRLDKYMGYVNQEVGAVSVEGNPIGVNKKTLAPFFFRFEAITRPSPPLFPFPRR